MKTLNGQWRRPMFGHLNGRQAHLILDGFDDVSPETMLSLAEDVRQALMRLGVARVSVRVMREEADDPDFSPGA